jgi:murein DD-endopeptidase MepM/ murein hydrolase activator NlpD
MKVGHLIQMLSTSLASFAAVVSMEGCATLQGPEIAYPRSAPRILSDYYSITGVAGGTRPQRHSGIDIQGRLGDTYGSIGEPVLAAADGVVIMSYWHHGGGNSVIIDHGKDMDGNFLATMYFHNSENLVSVGQQVKRGQQIAKVGQTGAAVGGAPHVHFQVYRGATKFAAPENFNVNDYHHNPHEYWVDGPYKVTCFDPKRNYPASPIRFTYPVECK